MLGSIGFVATVCFAAVAVAVAGPTPIPLRTSSGYRDYCDGMKKAKRPSCPPGRVPARLWRPIAFPVVGAAGECPVSKAHRISRRFAPVLGPKPVYVGTYGYQGDSAVVEMPFPAPNGSPAYGTGWTLTKILLTMRNEVRQPLLVRGRRLDDVGSLGFSGSAGRRPFAAMQFPTTKAGIREGKFKQFGLEAWVTAPGCYGIQIDGKTFRHVVVFRAVFSNR